MIQQQLAAHCELEKKNNNHKKKREREKRRKKRDATLVMDAPATYWISRESALPRDIRVAPSASVQRIIQSAILQGKQ